MKKFIPFLLASILIPFTEVVTATSYEVLYAASENNIETTSPLDDLKGDEDFKSAYENGDYHIGDNTGYRVIDLGEYKYGTSGYALYIYVWNCEQDSRFDYESPRNRIEILNQKTEEYIHLNVDFISKSSTIFYKYKVEFDKSTVSFVKGNNDERVYSIVGFEAYEYGETNAVDYTVGKTFKYRGYYYDDTLECETSDLETLHLDVHGGTYRTASSSESETSRNDLFYVWFPIKKNLFTKYGNLYSIHCDYYKFDLSYKINALLNDYLYELDSYTGVTVDTHNDVSEYEGYYYGWEQYPYQVLGPSVGQYMVSHDWYPYMSNAGVRIFDLNTKITGTYLDSIFSLNDVCQMVGVNFNSIALDESKGYYNNISISADVNYDLISYGTTHNGWDNFWAKLRGVNVDEVDLTGIKAIERFESASSINDCVCLDADDKSEMATYKSTHSSEDIVCFRFATGVYDSTSIRHGKYNERWLSNYEIGFMPIRGMYAFMDFDIIDVTFMNTLGEKTVLPVVANPVNVWASLENTTFFSKNIDWMTIIRLLLTILGLVAAILICFWLLTKTLKFDNSGVNRSSRRRKSPKRYRHK